MKVLFVCRGNVARSQMAEAIFNQLTNGNHSSQSAGIEAMGSEGKDLNGMLLRDRESSKHVIESMKRIGMDLTNNFIKRLTLRMVEDADKIILMIKPEMTPEFLKDSEKVIYWNIADPDEQKVEFYELTRDKIKKLVEEFVDSNLED